MQAKVAVVTGAARGIGEAIALRLLQEGAYVVLVDLDPAVRAKAADLRVAGYRCEAQTVDVAEAPAVQSLASELAGRLGIDILVNNAGISPKREGRKFFVAEMDIEGWNQVMAVNLTSVFLLSQACVPSMRQRGGGRIINISSQSARTRPLSTSGHYAASKAGVTGFSRALANEVGEFGITVNCIAPGLIETEMFKGFSPERREAAVSQVPLRKLGQPWDVAAAAAFLASEDARYLTGTTIDVNGGLFMT
ncbi:MAG: SDR family oxidoreductase [Haliea sp.]|nr:MAG: SDR family oxidoreductase [Haliea sp.]